MKYRLFKKELNITYDTITEFEAPENLSHIRIERGLYNGIIDLIGLESVGPSIYPNKKYKLLIIEYGSEVEYTVDYEPKITYAGLLTIYNGRKFYCYLIS